MKLLSFISQFLESSLEKASTHKKYINNLAWLLGDKIIRQGASFFIGIKIAKYLGATEFGVWNYVIALCGLYSAFAMLGLDSILVREIVKKSDSEGKLLGTSALLKFGGSIVALILSLITIIILKGFDQRLILITLITAGTFLFQITDVIDYYFQAHVKTRLVIIARSIAFALSAGWKIYFIVAKFELTSFVWAGFMEIGITSLIMVILFKPKRIIETWRWSKSTASLLLKHSWPLAISSLVIMLYMRVDQVMIGQINNEHELGLYSAAVKICELTYFIPTVICSAIYPGIIKSHSTNKKLYLSTLSWLYFGMFWMSVFIAVVVCFFSEEFISILYGKGFDGAGQILMIYILSGIPTFLGVATSQYLMAEGLTSLSLYRTLMGLTVNILLNIILIPKWGAVGASIATLISYSLATFSLVFFKSTHKHGLFLIKSLIYPSR